MDEETSPGRKVQTDHVYITLNKWLERAKTMGAMTKENPLMSNSA